MSTNQSTVKKIEVLQHEIDVRRAKLVRSLFECCPRRLKMVLKQLDKAKPTRTVEYVLNNGKTEFVQVNKMVALGTDQELLFNLQRKVGYEEKETK